MRMPKFGLVAVLCAFSGGACTATSERGCPVHPAGQSNAYGLAYDVTEGGDCPVPLTYIGELKDLAGTVTAHPDNQLFLERIEVQNYKGYVVQSGSDFFDSLATRKQAMPTLRYPAGTGYSGSGAPPDPIPDSTSDYPNWYAYERGNGSAAATGYMKIFYRASYVASIVSGNDVPVHGTPQTWTASATGGTAPYTHTWYRDGQLVSQTNTYSTTVDTSDFGLTLESRDASGELGHKDMLVDVDGIRASVSGPSTVYYSRGGGTWTASGRGGTTAYSYSWYLDIGPGQPQVEWLGDGASWSGYPGEGAKRLTVQMRNQEGAMNAFTVNVKGIGNETCAPEPPALRCTQ